jgi:hypothetical protein
MRRDTISNLQRTNHTPLRQLPQLLHTQTQLPLHQPINLHPMLPRINKRNRPMIPVIPLPLPRQKTAAILALRRSSKNTAV